MTNRFSTTQHKAHFNLPTQDMIHSQPHDARFMGTVSRFTFIRHHHMFRTHPDMNTARMILNHQLSIGWEVCTPPHFNLQYTQYTSHKIVRSLVFGL